MIIQQILKRLSFWGFVKPFDCSWAWGNMLNLRKDICHDFTYNLGDGKQFSFWYDPWFHGTSVRESFPSLQILESDIPKHAKVAEIWRHN